MTDDDAATAPDPAEPTPAEPTPAAPTPAAPTPADATPPADGAKPSKADRLIARAERLKEQEALRAAAAAARAADPGSVRGSRGWVASTVVLAVVAVLLAAGLVVTSIGWSRAHDSDQRQRDLAAARTGSLAAAKSYAIAFGSYDYQHLDADFGKTAKLMTTSFAANYKKTSAALAQTFTAYKTQVTASVPAAAVVSATSSRAVVLVLLDQVITSSQSSTPKINRNRLEVTLVHTHGSWLVDRTDAT